MRGGRHERLTSWTPIAVFAVLHLAGSVAAGQPGGAADLVLGSWTLDLERSSFRPGPPPKSQTRSYEAHLDGVKTTVRTVDSEGRSLSSEYVADYDSLEYPITGSSTVDAISLKRITSHVAEATLTHARKVIGTARRTISEDGQTMTISYQGTGRDGRPVVIVAVYSRDG